MADTTVKGTVLLGWSHPIALVLPNCMLVVETGPDAGKRFGPLRVDHVRLHPQRHLEGHALAVRDLAWATGMRPFCAAPILQMT